ncbi:unnamed protein product [Hermetia illucens]|uniref:Uncharacterized protein n=1 Tax=Hermetia illucens TaxID=343691 RepID=A0A7R8YQ52_HERIL|nr:unnamed protein product [Hermetia illucens]
MTRLSREWFLMNWNLSGLLLLAEDKFDSGVLDIVRARNGTDFWCRQEPVIWLRFKLVLMCGVDFDKQFDDI